MQKKHLYISVIIPTLNRSKSLKETLQSISQCCIKPGEILCIDQSYRKHTRSLTSQFNTFSIKYLYSTIQSSSIARNIGIQHLQQDTDIVVFLDDDVLVEKDFFGEIEKFFLQHPNAKGGMASIITPTTPITFGKKIGLFLLSGTIKGENFSITSGGANIIPYTLPQKIIPVEWTHGCGMFFRKSVLNEGFKFESQFMKYSFMEDCFFSYSIHTKYPNSLFFVPSIKLTHNQSPLSRINYRQKIYQSIIHRYFFIKKFHKNFYSYLWTVFIYGIYDFIQYKTWNVIIYYYQGIKYIFQNKNQIGQNNFDFNQFIFG